MFNRQQIWHFFLQRDFSSYQYLLGVLLVVFPIYGYGVYQQWDINQNLNKIDQSAYISYSKEIATEFNFRGDHNRMPLYPAIQALHYTAGQSDETFFRDGKALNVGLSIISILGLSLFFWRVLAPFSATIAISLTAIFVYPFITPYFMVEVLFLALFFICFLLGGYLLWHPSLKLALILGILLGLGHLAKASIMALLAIFLLLYLAQAIVEYTDLKKLRQQLLVMGIVMVSFIGVIYPYIADSKQVFGSYFYNVNTTFYVWYDSWTEVREGTRAYGDRDHYPDMPADEIPSLSKYVREHSIFEMGARLVKGLGHNFINHTFKSFGYGKYIWFYVIILAGQTFQQRALAWRFLKQHKWLVLYSLVVFVAYHFAFAWYMPISTAKRFLLTLWLPCITVMFWLTGRLNLYRAHVICLAIMAIDIIWVWSANVGEYNH